ncbi:MAG: cation transporter [Actinomycetota bacterium]|nr:cation transporter [Actinomycetota bacterium]
MSQTITLQVEGMSCAGCEHRLGVALQRLEGVQDATADHRTGTVRVRFDPDATGTEALVDRVVTAGYHVTGQGEASPR